MTPDPFDRVFTCLPDDQPMRRDTFSALSEDYDFWTAEEVDAILALPVGESLSDGYAIWTRVS